MPKAKRLYLAIVEHSSCPGVQCALFEADKEPSDRRIKTRFAMRPGVRVSDIEVTHVMDVTHACLNDPASKEALRNAYLTVTTLSSLTIKGN